MTADPSAAAECVCFHYDESETPGVCECGHVDDEHDDEGNCTVETTP